MKSSTHHPKLRKIPVLPLAREPSEPKCQMIRKGRAVRTGVRQAEPLPETTEAVETVASGQYLRPLTRATLPQEVVGAIANLIMNRVWKPGDRIPSEKELADRFGVGRSTIREAI